MITQAQADFARMVRELGDYTRRDVTQGVKLGKYKKSALGMMEMEPVAANLLLGLAACLEHDSAAMHDHHKKALELSESLVTLMYYSASLEKCCLWGEAVRFALMALDKDPENPKLLDEVIRMAPLTGRFSLYKRLLEQKGGWAPLPEASQCEAVGDLLTANGMLERDLKSVLDGIGCALSQTDVILRDYSFSVVPVPEAPFLHYRFVIPDEFSASYYEDLVRSGLRSLPLHPRTFEVVSFSVENTAVRDLYRVMEMEGVDGGEPVIPDPERLKAIGELVHGVEART
ncbi:hypothetical protein L4X63_08040 [Geomonas sp. Red32]|uniref:hypothetical protein n=1 Tax=Geomonas sp. Red32 TaxID=2912856 RepID=UPI00202D005D|nr:hypothetical protein [Geomonas sp. Red32]MCM0081534.1 hypothetical protein [Geomonas sp. Red32]